MVSADLPGVGDRRHVFDERAQTVLCLLEVPLRLFLLCDVLRDHRETPQFALIIVQRCQDRVCPEPRSILAHEPVLLYGAAFAGRRLEVFLRLAQPGVFFCEECGEVLSDDLIRVIAFETFGTRVPACHAPLRVEREDGVIPHAFYQRAEMFLVPAQAFSVALGLQLATLSPHSRGAQRLGKQADECPFQEEHEKRHGLQAEYLEGASRWEEKVVCGQACCDRREQSWSEAPVPGAYHNGAEDQQERGPLHDQGVEEQLDQERHPDGQDGNAVPQERRRVFYGEHLVFPSKAEGRSPLSLRVAVRILTSRYTHDTILRLQVASGIPKMKYFGIFITL